MINVSGTAIKRVALLAAAALVLLAAACWGLLGDLPAPEALITRSSPDATKILDRHGRLLFEILDPRAGRRTRVALSDLPRHLSQAVIAVEDANFYQHPGVDVTGLARAVVQVVRAGHTVSGGSTITMQLARALLLSKEERESRTLTRKLREMVLAVRLSRVYAKETILEMYLNEVYFGQLAYGVEAASQAYFGKPARELDLAESALLAGLIQSPADYDPLVHLNDALERQGIVLGLMVKSGALSQAQADMARAETIHFAPQTHAGTVLRAPHFVSYVRDLLESAYGPERVARGGLHVLTTLDLDLQERAEAVVRQQLADLARQTREEGAPDYGVHNGALVALDPATGEILAMVGSADYFDNSINGAVDVALADRQPGSSIKPITYAAAFARDLTPASVFNDVPTTFRTKEGDPYTPQNYDRQWHGPISLRQALATSSNMVAVQVLDHIGLDAMLTTARSLGISTFQSSERFGLALTLGGGEVKLLELTAAYAAFANSGRKVEPRAILSVDNTPYGEVSQQPQAVSPQVAFLVTDILSDDQARIPAFGESSILQLDRPAAAKTGTTTDFRDNWTVGYTPDLAVGVWVGNADNQSMNAISGITGAGPIWHNFMEAALKDRAPRPFTRPAGVVQAETCETSGLLATAACPRRRSEVFIAGSQPTRYDDTYRSLAIDGATGLLWAEGCAGPRQERVFRFLPPEDQEWGWEQGIAEPPVVPCRPLADIADGEPDAPPMLLIITNPDDGAIFALSPQIPPALQQIEISTRWGSPQPGAAGAQQAALQPRTWAEVRVLVDGESIGALTAAPYRLFWQLAAGEHSIQAIAEDQDGHRVESNVVRFKVELDGDAPNAGR